jgi:hypothetical protein
VSAAAHGRIVSPRFRCGRINGLSKQFSGETEQVCMYVKSIMDVMTRIFFRDVVESDVRCLFGWVGMWWAHTYVCVCARLMTVMKGLPISLGKDYGVERVFCA